MYFVDSSFIIALFNKNNPILYSKANFILNNFPEINKSSKAINNIVFNEVLNKLRKSYFRNQREEIIEFLYGMDKLIFVNREVYREALKKYEQYNYEINYSDWLIILSMKENGIKNIISFDSDFNRINGINNFCI